MKKLSIIVFLILIFGSNSICGQMRDFYWGDPANMGNPLPGKLMGTNYSFLVGASNNHFYHKDWNDGTILTIDHILHENIRLRYDGFHDELIAFNVRTNGLLKVDKSTVSGFTVLPGSGKAEKYRKIMLPGIFEKTIYAEVLYEGDVQLVRSNRIEEYKTSVYKDRLGKLNNTMFLLNQQYYIVKPDQSVQRMNAGRKPILNLFPERKKEIRRMLRKQEVYSYRVENLPAIIRLLDENNYFGN